MLVGKRDRSYGVPAHRSDTPASECFDSDTVTRPGSNALEVLRTDDEGAISRNVRLDRLVRYRHATMQIRCRLVRHDGGRDR